MTGIGQLTYGSLAAVEGRSGGWQVQQVSRGLTMAERELMTAQVCTSIDPPVALPRFPTPEQLTLRPRRLTFRGGRAAGVWCHAVPAGADASGREGNVFSHVLLRTAWGQTAGGPDVGRPVDWWTAIWLQPFGARQVEGSRFLDDEPPNPEDPGGLRESVLDLLFDLADSPRRTLLRAWLDAVRSVLQATSGREPVTSGGPGRTPRAPRPPVPRTVVLALEDTRQAARWIGLASYLTAPQVGRRLSFSTFDRLRDVVRRQSGDNTRSVEPLLLRVIPRTDLATAVPGQLDRVIVVDELAPPTLSETADGETWHSPLGAVFATSEWGAAAHELVELGRERAADLLVALDFDALGHWQAGEREGSLPEKALQRVIDPERYPWPEPEPEPEPEQPKAAPVPAPLVTPTRRDVDPMHSLPSSRSGAAPWDGSFERDDDAEIVEYGPLSIQRTEQLGVTMPPADDGSRLPDETAGSALPPSPQTTGLPRRAGQATPTGVAANEILDHLATLLSDHERLVTVPENRSLGLSGVGSLPEEDVRTVLMALTQAASRLPDFLRQQGSAEVPGPQRIHPGLVLLAAADLVARIWAELPNSVAHELWPEGVHPSKLLRRLCKEAIDGLDDVDPADLRALAISLDLPGLASTLETALADSLRARGLPRLDRIGTWPPGGLLQVLPRHQEVDRKMRRQVDAETSLAAALQTGRFAGSVSASRVRAVSRLIIAYYRMPGADDDWWREIGDRLWGEEGEAAALPPDVAEEFALALTGAEEEYRTQIGPPPVELVIPALLAWWQRTLMIRDPSIRRRVAGSLVALLPTSPTAVERPTLMAAVRAALGLIARPAPAVDPASEKAAILAALTLPQGTALASTLAPWLVLAAVRTSTEALRPAEDIDLADALRRALQHVSYQQLTQDPTLGDALRRELGERLQVGSQLLTRDDRVWKKVYRHPYVLSGSWPSADDPIFATIGPGPREAGTTVAALVLDAAGVTIHDRWSAVPGGVLDESASRRLTEFFPRAGQPTSAATETRPLQERP